VPAPAPADYGRLDAVGAIVNEVYYHSVKNPTSPTDNTKQASAPVSYPFLWDTPQQELEHGSGLPRAAAARPLQSLAQCRRGPWRVRRLRHSRRPLPAGYSSSIKFFNLVDLENELKGLWSPQWPADFPPINQADATKGKAIYLQLKCDTCHALVANRKDPNRIVNSYMKADQTDPGSYLNFFNRNGPSGKLEGPM